MRQVVIAALLAVPLWANAAPVNLVSNGSFESGLAGWTVSGTTGDAKPASVITYNSAAPYPTGASGEAVLPDHAINVGPDATGTHALYFSSDSSTEVISQIINVTSAGLYYFGLDVYLPANGFASANDAFLGITLGSTNFGTYPLSSFGATTWTPGAATITLAAGSYNLALAFTSASAPAKDIVVDRVYLTSTPQANDGSLPEPSTAALTALALVSLALCRRRA